MAERSSAFCSQCYIQMGIYNPLKQALAVKRKVCLDALVFRRRAPACSCSKQLVWFRGMLSSDRRELTNAPALQLYRDAIKAHERKSC